MSLYETFDDLCLLATTVERQFNESKKSMVTASSSTRVGDSPSTSQDKHTPDVKAALNTSQNRVCYRCKGYGNMQADFPSKVLISLSDHLALLSQLHEDEWAHTSSSPIAHVFTGKGEDVKDFTRAHHAIPMLSPKSDDKDVLTNVYTIAHGGGRIRLQLLPPQPVATKELRKQLQKLKIWSRLETWLVLWQLVQIMHINMSPRRCTRGVRSKNEKIILSSSSQVSI
uniref:Uncharacterized protein n=1 Tax=Chenopodium quinoa TaxID=63459 RepID=A0A803N1J2_CHEQI